MLLKNIFDNFLYFYFLLRKTTQLISVCEYANIYYKNSIGICSWFDYQISNCYTILQIFFLRNLNDRIERNYFILVQEIFSTTHFPKYFQTFKIFPRTLGPIICHLTLKRDRTQKTAFPCRKNSSEKTQLPIKIN